MSAINLLMDTLALRPTYRRPIWVMRQAGRYLPEYRAVRQQHSFKVMVETPDIATEITLQPVRRFGVDAAIIFSDILVLLEALGVSYEIVEGQGPVLARSVRTAADFASLSTEPVTDSLGYVYETLSMLRKELPPEVALLGFAGAPWTLASYIIEGGNSRGGFPAIHALLDSDPPLFGKVMDRITDGVIDHLKAQLSHGADAVQLFDSWAGMLNAADFRRAALPYLLRIAKAMKDDPVIYYPKGAGQWLTREEVTKFSIIGVDSRQSLAFYREKFGPDFVLQGNLDPAIMKTDARTIRLEARAVLDSHGPGPGHIFNLGHGITPDVPPDHMQALVDAVHEHTFKDTT
ncbi:MAG: uroporphyrinogen decarboxylase [Candidatus Marinimicrobia bacterium]|nr:uroporphyrinogen decarboxylase [Candidatus Neomarinimicrobiota bacterium]